MKRTNLEMLTIIAKALEEILDQVVFVGGATVQFRTDKSSLGGVAKQQRSDYIAL